MTIEKMNLGVLIFNGFELLDVFGPLEMFGMFPEHFSISMVAEQQNIIESSQGPKSVADHLFSEQHHYDVLLVPGGKGTRSEINNPVVIQWLIDQADRMSYVCSVCTGSALLAKACLLDGKQATTNKLAFDWVAQQSANVNWLKQARWVQDGKYFTSSGVSAGIDMALALIEHILGSESAEQAARWAEYQRNVDPNHDPFAIWD